MRTGDERGYIEHFTDRLTDSLLVDFFLFVDIANIDSRLSFVSR